MITYTVAPDMPSFGSGVMTLLSTLNVATLLSLMIGVCIVYDHSWRDTYFRLFGLDSNAVPTSMQDSIVSGFVGLSAHVLWLLLILTVLIAGYVATIWLGTNWLAKVAPRLDINDRGTPPATLVALGKSGGFKTWLVVSTGAIALTITSGSAMFLVGLPGKRPVEMMWCTFGRRSGQASRCVSGIASQEPSGDRWAQRRRFGDGSVCPWNG